MDRDSQGEILDLAGADISQMVSKGFFNDNHSNGFINTLGRITEVKKILKKEDASTDREKMYWEQMQRPFLYTRGYLFDDSDHPNAKAVAAIMKEFKKQGTPLDVKMSVEGKVTERGHGGLIKQCMIRNVALTLVPANGATGSQIAGNTLKKSILPVVAAEGGHVGYADSLIKSMSTGSIVSNKWTEAPELKLSRNIELVQKALSAGYGSTGSPQTKTGGSALASESLDGKISAVAADRKKKLFKAIVKAMIEKHPDVPVQDVLNASIRAFNHKFNS